MNTEEEKNLKEYQHKLRVVGAMDLYGLDRETAEQLSTDVEELIDYEVEKVRTKCK